MTLQIAKGTNQTFQLVPEAYQAVKTIELQAGDRLEGSFIVSNLGPYRNLLNETSGSYVWINVDFKNPSGQTVLNYTNYPTGGATFSSPFNYTAVDWGSYSVWVFCGGNWLFENHKNPEMTIDYSVTNANPNPDLTLIPPVISVRTPQNSTRNNSSSMVLNFNVSIPNSGSNVGSPKWWTYYSADWIKGVGDDDTVLIDMQSSPAPKEYSVNFSGIPEGEHRMTVYATSWLESGHYANSAISQVLIIFNIDLTPPRISSLSIENKTYSSAELPLSFVVDGGISQLSYSLDNQTKVAIYGNSTLKDLAPGNHSLTVYAVDSAGNMGESETASFSVETPFPILFAATVLSVVVAVLVAVAAVVYVKKRRR